MDRQCIFSKEEFCVLNQNPDICMLSCLAMERLKPKESTKWWPKRSFRPALGSKVEGEIVIT